MNALVHSTSDFQTRAAFPRDAACGPAAKDALPLTAKRVSMASHHATFSAVNDYVIRMSLTPNTPIRVNVGNGWRVANVSSGLSIVLTTPGQELEFDAPEPHKMLVLSCAAPDFSKLLADHCLDIGEIDALIPDGLVMDDSRATALVLDIWREINKRDALATPLLVKGYWNLLIGHILSTISAPKRQCHFGLSQKNLDAIDTFIDNHLADPITASQLADLANMHAARFTKEFRAARDMTPYQYVLNRRIDKARLHIAESELPLASIAVICGFSSQSHMTDTFRCKLGLSPGAFR